ncbi:uncharacterized protein B0I36DRAFT_360317 [Microdochium trichocladiopsis]|uniref:Uncharacterized protein n=1 Tax=Microdochium trichocladiopsis TaxID=1682393 RepID=A0A9P8YD34_9PEZI|nr:uncharacterized protein B0I36DRAFT_360317 [Microdochium trichocladiopsis]KAH7034848.1 hypothetical protein B0I36DRAFT_360317 [Microdochium trichocladiopsis]
MGCFSNNNARKKSKGDDPTMEYYPLGVLDVRANAGFIPVVLMRFNDVLEGDKLRDALTRLLQTGDWRKLAGRFVADPTDKKLCRVEVPRDPKRIGTAEWPAVEYSNAHFDVCIDDHPLGRKIPAANQDLKAQAGIQEFASFWKEPWAPKIQTVQCYIRHGRKPVSLRVTTFADATLVGVSWMHVVMDGLAFKAFMTAWTLSLAGRLDEVKPVSRAHEDVLKPLYEADTAAASVASSVALDKEKSSGTITPEDANDVHDAASRIPREPYALADKSISGWSRTIVFLRFMVYLLLQPGATSRTLVLPPAFLAELREEAERGLPPVDSKDGSRPFVSDGDILCAWLTRLVAQSHGWRGPIMQLNLVDLRSRVPGVFDPQAVYLQNMCIPAITLLDAGALPSAGAARSTPQSSPSVLGSWAAEIRGSIAQQATPGQLRAFYRRVLPKPLGEGASCIMGGPKTSITCVSNWVKAKFILETDFSPAVVPATRSVVNMAAAKEIDVEAGLAPPPTPSGKMVGMLSGQFHNARTNRDTTTLVGKDHQGNYWLSLFLAKGVVKTVEKHIERAEQARARR